MTEADYMATRTESLLNKGVERFSPEKLDLIAALHSTAKLGEISSPYVNWLIHKLTELDKPWQEVPAKKENHRPRFHTFAAFQIK